MAVEANSGEFVLRFSLLGAFHCFIHIYLTIEALLNNICSSQGSSIISCIIEPWHVISNNVAF